MNAMRMEDTCDALGAIMKRMLLYDHHGDILFFRDCANTSSAPKAQRTTTSVPFHVPQPPAPSLQRRAGWASVQRWSKFQQVR